MNLGARKRCQLIRGDCLQILPRIPDASIDAFVTDPPYGINLQLKCNRLRPLSIAGDKPDQARRLWQQFLPHAHRLAKDNTAHLFFGTWKSIWIRDLIAEHFTIKGCIVWYKNTWGMGYWLRPRWELIWYCHKGKPTLTGSAPPDVWEHNRDHKLRHPCQKPIDLLRRAIRFVAQPGQIICDPFAGIGSTAVAAIEEGCHFVGSELSARHHRLAQRRIDQALSAQIARETPRARETSTGL